MMMVVVIVEMHVSAVAPFRRLTPPKFQIC